MPDFLPDRVEAGTVNVSGIAGLAAGMEEVERVGIKTIFARQQRQVRRCAAVLKKNGIPVFAGKGQAGVLSFLPGTDCQQMADRLAEKGIAVRAGLHCAPLAHESAGTLSTGTVRISFGHDAQDVHSTMLLSAIRKLS